MNALLEMLSFPFMTRALIAGSLIALSAALLGVTLVLKRYSMIGDGLSHVGFGAMAVAALLNVAPLVVAIPVVVIAAFILLRFQNQAKLRGDTAIAVISTGFLAVGVILIHFSKGGNIDLMNYMFGSILALREIDVWTGIVLSVIVTAAFILLYNRIFAITFDETFAKATGIRTGFYNTVLAILTAITIVLGMRLMGALLISGLIIFPAITAMNLFRSFKKVVVTSGIVAVVSVVSGLIVSYFFGIPTGAGIVCINVTLLILSALISRIIKKD